MYPVTRSTLILASVLLVAGCAAPAPLAAPRETSAPSTGPYYVAESDYERNPAVIAYAVDEWVFDGEPAGRHVLPVRYERGVEETIRWEGTGPGVAMLTNGYGQMIYRIEEGGEPFRGLIPPGDYVLTLTNATPRDGQVLTAPIAVRGLALERQLLWRAHPGLGVSRGGKGSRPPRGAANGGRVPA